MHLFISEIYQFVPPCTVDIYARQTQWDMRNADNYTLNLKVHFCLVKFTNLANGQG